MNQSLKAILQLTLILSIVFGGLAWLFLLDNSSSANWVPIRKIAPAVATLTAAVLLWAAHRKDKVPDFLSQLSPRFLERDGFCFLPDQAILDGVCCNVIFFQNRFERRCTARMRAAFVARDYSAREEIEFVIECGPAAFGRAIVPWKVPANLRGKQIATTYSTSVSYPEGTGAMLRYREGHRVGKIGFDLGRDGAIIAGAAHGYVRIGINAHLSDKLPEALSDRPLPAATTKLFWTLGDSHNKVVEGILALELAPNPIP